MMKRISPFAMLLATLVMVSPHPTHADELKLKDGTKIVGTIVGFEENSFKVKTNYGFAVVQKDQVLSISITDSGKKLDAEKKSEPSAEKPVPPAPGARWRKIRSPPARWTALTGRCSLGCRPRWWWCWTCPGACNAPS